MIRSNKVSRAVAILAVTVLVALTGWAAASAHTEPTSFGITVDFREKVVVDDSIHINMRRGTEVTTTRLVVLPGGHTPWHYHPGPHVVAVTDGNVTVYETDCSVRGQFAAGGGFYDPGTSKPRLIHTLYNPGSAPAEVIITDFREPGLALTVPVDPQPADCF
jgi:hypothetical protein